jgi:hypothetical protein
MKNRKNKQKKRTVEKFRQRSKRKGFDLFEKEALLQLLNRDHDPSALSKYPRWRKCRSCPSCPHVPQDF